MRFNSADFRLSLPVAALMAGIAAIGLTMPAAAGGLYHEHAYADSFGNFVVYSPSGYKRIVVGKGYLADQVASAETGHGPNIVHLERAPGRYYYDEGGHGLYGECAVLLHGRSYMYGLPDNVVPVPAKNCN